MFEPFGSIRKSDFDIPNNAIALLLFLILYLPQFSQRLPLHTLHFSVELGVKFSYSILTLLLSLLAPFSHEEYHFNVTIIFQ